MIGESLINLFLNLFSGLFGAIEFVNLPTQLIQTLTTILAYGNWVVGIDIMALFAGSIIGWWAIDFTIGIAVWLWKMLPLT